MTQVHDDPGPSRVEQPLPAGVDVGFIDLEATAPGPDGKAGTPAEFGLAMSGGGLRATLFHLGALMRLRELGYLERLDRVSGVSGGSIMAAILAKAWPRLQEAGFTAAAFEEHVTRPTLHFAQQKMDAWVIGMGLVPFVNPSDRLAAWFERELSGQMTLDELPVHPRFVFNAATLATGVSWRFSRPYMGDSRIGLVRRPRVKVARAVAASASFPPFVAPLVLRLSGMEVEQPAGATLLDRPQYASLGKEVRLLDGGAYDNLAIEQVEGRCRVVLASDAGGNLSVDTRTWRYHLWWPLIRRTLDLAVEGGRAQRRRALIDRAQLVQALPPGHELRTKLVTERVALWRTLLDLTGRPLPGGGVIAPGWNLYLASRPTRLWPPKPADQRRLINWGYVTADAVIERWIPDLTPRAAAPAMPCPEADADLSVPPPTPDRWRDRFEVIAGFLASVVRR